LALTIPPFNTETERRRAKSERYLQISQRLLKHAQEQLEQGDTLQASEKAYGAVAHAVKSYGELRGWNHLGHYRFSLILDQLWDEERDPSLTEWYGAVESSHSNYFKDENSPTRVKDRVETARDPVGKLELLRLSAPNQISSSSLSQEQRRRLSLLMQPTAREQVAAEDLPPLEDLPE